MTTQFILSIDNVTQISDNKSENQVSMDIISANRWSVWDE